MTHEEMEAKAREFGSRIEELEIKHRVLFWEQFNNRDDPRRIEQAGSLSVLELNLGLERRAYHDFLEQVGARPPAKKSEGLYEVEEQVRRPS